MRSIAVIAFILWASCPAFGEATDRDALLHHQPSQEQIDEREKDWLADRTVSARSAGQSAEQIKARFLTACMARLDLDEPLGSEQRHRQFCTCRIDTLKGSITAGDIEAVALNLEERNAGSPIPDRLPPNVGRANQAGIQACMDELSR